MLPGHNRKKMLGAECMADMLRDYGVTHVFHVPAVLRRSFVEMERRTDIKRLHVHGEKSAAYMADGYARASGRPGVCMAQVIGALNLAAGLRDAWLAHSPVIAMTGGREPRTKFRGVYQEVDDMPSFEPVTKFNATVDDVTRFPDMVRQAFRVAVSGTPGPVHLQFRGNEGQVDAEEAELEPLCEPQFSRVPPFRPAPDETSVRAALAALQAAERPVVRPPPRPVLLLAPALRADRSTGTAPKVRNGSVNEPARAGKRCARSGASGEGRAHQLIARL
jgi:acetolactate synthase-1/2/3 large subunit